MKTWPCVLLSPPEMLSLRTVLVAPTTSQGFAAHFRPRLTFEGTTAYMLLPAERVIGHELAPSGGAQLFLTMPDAARQVAA